MRQNRFHRHPFLFMVWSHRKIPCCEICGNKRTPRKNLAIILSVCIFKCVDFSLFKYDIAHSNWVSSEWLHRCGLGPAATAEYSEYSFVNMIGRTLNPEIHRNHYLKFLSITAQSVQQLCGIDRRGVGFRVPVRSKIFTSPCRPDHLWGQPSFLLNWHRGLFRRR
jgi:hypothetical protein